MIFHYFSVVCMVIYMTIMHLNEVITILVMTR